MVTPEGVELCPFYGGAKALLKSSRLLFFEGLIEFRNTFIYRLKAAHNSDIELI